MLELTSSKYIKLFGPGIMILQQLDHMSLCYESGANINPSAHILNLKVVLKTPMQLLFVPRLFSYEASNSRFLLPISPSPR